MVAQLNEQRRETSEAVRHLSVEKLRFQAQTRKLDLDLQKARAETHKLKQENLSLQKRFDEASPDQGTYVLRLDHEHILNELGRLSSSMTRQIELRKSESENVSMTRAMPPSDALQSPWAPGEFNVLDDPVIPDDMAPMLSTSEALALPNFATVEFENRLPLGHTHFLSQRPTQIALSSVRRGQVSTKLKRSS